MRADATDGKIAGHARILCFATQGEAHLDAKRLRYLLEPLDPRFFAFDRSSRLRSAIRLARELLERRPQLVVMEGTGVGGGVTLLLFSVITRAAYVVSSGDAVGPYLGVESKAVGILGALYERLLCRRCAGFIGWTPYLVGRAITFGAKRAMTAPGWPHGQASDGAREAIRDRLGISRDALVVGITGTLKWHPRIGYTYGAELVRAIRRIDRPDIAVCVVGDGPGREPLVKLAGDDLGRRIFLPGRVEPEEVPDYLAAFDVASLPQSVDRVGSFRYSTKLSDYLGAKLAIITGQIPAGYDLDDRCFWRLPGDAPWSPEYVDALAALLDELSASEIRERRQALLEPHDDPCDRLAQQRRAGEFIRDILADLDG